MWPAIMLANKRTARTTWRINSPATSMTNISPQSGGFSHHGTSRCGTIPSQNPTAPISRDPGDDHRPQGHQRQHPRDVDVARGRGPAGDHPQQVAEQDEEEEGPQERQELVRPVPADRRPGDVVADEQDHRLEQVHEPAAADRVPRRVPRQRDDHGRHQDRGHQLHQHEPRDLHAERASAGRSRPRTDSASGEVPGWVVHHMAQRAVAVSFRHGVIVPVGSIRQFRNIRPRASRPVAPRPSGGLRPSSPRGRPEGGASSRPRTRGPPPPPSPRGPSPTSDPARPRQRGQRELQPDGRDPRRPLHTRGQGGTTFGWGHVPLPRPRAIAREDATSCRPERRERGIPGRLGASRRHDPGLKTLYTLPIPAVNSPADLFEKFFTKSTLAIHHDRIQASMTKACRRRVPSLRM